jgi:protein SCO1/2
VEPLSNQTLEPTGLLKTFAATTAVLIAGLALLWSATGGAQGFTTETLRRQQVASQPQRIEAFNLTLATGQKTTLNALLAPGGKVWLVDFVYTRCQTLCSSLGSIYQQLQTQIEARGLQGKVGLLSVSFDPMNDDAIALTDYAKRMGMNPSIWQIVTLTDWQDRRRLLNAFGIMVVPAPLGEFEHNAALHVVSSDGTLHQIIDYTDFNSALDVAAGMAQDLVPRGASVAAIAP